MRLLRRRPQPPPLPIHYHRGDDLVARIVEGDRETVADVRACGEEFTATPSNGLAFVADVEEARDAYLGRRPWWMR